MGVKMEVNSSPELICCTWTVQTKFPITAKHCIITLRNHENQITENSPSCSLLGKIMMLIIFFSFTGKRSDTVDLIGVLIPKLRYSYWASWQTLNFMYIVFTVEDYYSFPLSNLYVFFMYYHNFPNFLRTLHRFERVTHLSPGILLLLCD